jgi:DNA-binding GntR family transcriptional regulator
MQVLASKIIERTGSLPEGTPIMAKELLHLASRTAVDQALSRLVRRGSLMRVGRGVYMRPVESRFGTRPPMASQVVEAIARQRGERVAPHGAAAANELGLTTQVPAREVYLTSGRSRHLKLGAQSIELRHVPAWQLLLPGRLAGSAIRALAWLGRKRAGEALRAIQGKLPPSELQAVLQARGGLPTWMAQEISILANTH